VGPHTAIRSVRSNFATYHWFIFTNLTTVVYDLSSDTIVSCLQKVVSDRKLLSLLKSALSAPSDLCLCRHQRRTSMSWPRRG
jgi:hypothetical protein